MKKKSLGIVFVVLLSLILIALVMVAAYLKKIVDIKEQTPTTSVEITTELPTTTPVETTTELPTTTPVETTTEEPTTTLEFNTQAFDPANLIYHAEIKSLEVKPILIDGMLGLEQFSGYTAEDILNFIFATYPSHLVKQKTALDLYEAINSYQEREYIEYLMSKRNNQQQTEDATGKEEIQTPTSPTEYTYTEIKVVKSASTNIDIYADASGSSQKVGTITKYSKVAIQRQCNETGWYEVIAIPMINNKLVAEFAVQGYIHPDAYPYLYDKMNPLLDDETNALNNALSKYTIKDIQGKQMEVVASVNVRNLPSTDGEKIDALDKGKVIFVKAVCEDTGWYKVEYYSNNLDETVYDGFVPANNLKDYVESQTPEYTYKDFEKTMYAKSGVNVRDLPSTDGNKIGSLSASQSVTVTGQCNETSWYRIEYNGSIGYVSGNYLVSEIPTQTPTQKPTNSYIEYAPAGEVFTDSTSVTIDGQLITVTSDMKIGNTIIAENLSGDDVRIQVDGDALGFYQSKSVRDVYSDIYGEENVAVDWGEAGDYTILITRTYEYAPAGEVFTDSTSITIDGQPITVTGSTKIHNTIIAENLSGVNIKIKVGKSGLIHSQAWQVKKAYSDIYGEDNIGLSSDAAGNYTIVINPQFHDATGEGIQINRH